jgi:hypothetical protein
MREPEQEQDFATSILPKILEFLEYEALALEQAAEALQEAQEQIPLPSRQEIAEIRSHRRPMSRPAYVLARLQRAIVTVEDVASDLRTDMACGFDPEGVELVESIFNALEAAATRDR